MFLCLCVCVVSVRFRLPVLCVLSACAPKWFSAPVLLLETKQRMPMQTRGGRHGHVQTLSALVTSVLCSHLFPFLRVARLDIYSTCYETTNSCQTSDVTAHQASGGRAHISGEERERERRNKSQQAGESNAQSAAAHVLSRCYWTRCSDNCRCLLQKMCDDNCSGQPL